MYFLLNKWMATLASCIKFFRIVAYHILFYWNSLRTPCISPKSLINKKRHLYYATEYLLNCFLLLKYIHMHTVLKA